MLSNVKKNLKGVVFCQIPVILLSAHGNIFPQLHNSIVNMIHLKGIMGKLTILAAFSFLMFFSNQSFSQDGKALFQANCASCHAINKQLTGPALAGVEDRWSNKANLYAWIKNNQAFLKTGDKYANDLYNQYNKTAMNLFTNLEDKDIDAILTYIKSVPATPAPTPNDPNKVGQPATDSDSTLLF